MQFIDAPNRGNSAVERREGVAFVYALKVLNESPFVEGKGCAARCETPVDKGDVLHVIETENGIELTPYDPEFNAQMAVAEEIMYENRDLLRRLAK